MRRVYRYALAKLAEDPTRYLARNQLPNGIGHCMTDQGHYASAETMDHLEAAGFVDRDQWLYGITPRGLHALTQAPR